MGFLFLLPALCFLLDLLFLQDVFSVMGLLLLVDAVEDDGRGDDEKACEGREGETHQARGAPLTLLLMVLPVPGGVQEALHLDSCCVRVLLWCPLRVR